MTNLSVTREPSAPETALCRCFCRHYVALTGTGLAASARLETQIFDQDQNDD